MSRRLLGKLDIDVLVQLAWLGPSDVETWRPVTDAPDEFGTMLWSRNFEVAGYPDDDPLPDYRFAPLPVTLTAIEGVKQCDYYRSNTATDDDRWLRGGLGRAFSTLREQLLFALPEHRAAPWGWTGADLRRRADRPAPVTPEPILVDARVQDLFDRWAAAGLELLGGGDVPESILTRVTDPRSVLACASHRPPVHSGIAPVLVLLSADEGTARAMFAHEVKENQWRRNRYDARVYRFGNTVATTVFSPGREDHHIASVDARIATLGPPDEHWWSLAPPVQQVAGEVLASRVRLSPAAGTHQDGRAVVARTPREVQALSDMLADDEVKALLVAINTRKQTAVLLRGVSEVTSVHSGLVVDEIVDVGLGPEVEHRLILNTAGATMATATLILLDRLPRTPALATILDPGIQRSLIGDKPRPVG